MKGGCLVKEIQMKNFRSLKDTGSRKLSPITLLVGENSSGKSSFLRAFPLLKQSISKRTSGPILWAGDVDDYVDFGSFEETVTNDQSDEIIFAFKFQLNDDGRTSGYRFYDDYGVFEYTSSGADICYEITITSSEGKDQVSNLSLCVNSTTVRFDLRKGTITSDKGLSYKETNQEPEITLGKHSGKIPFRRYTRMSPSFGFELPAIDTALYTVLHSISLDKDEEVEYFIIRRLINEIGLDLTRKDDIEYIDDRTRKKKKYPAAAVKYYNSIVSAIKDDPTGELREIAKLVAIYDLFPEIDDPCSHTHCHQNHAHQPTDSGYGIEHQRRYQRKRRINNGCDHASAGHIAEVTEGHGNGLCDLRHNVHRGHDHNRLCKTLQPASKAVVFNIIVPDDHRNHNSPGEGTAQIRRYRPQKAGHTDETAADTAQKQGAHKRRPVCVVLTHG